MREEQGEIQELFDRKLTGKKKLKEELGDLLFAVVNVSRKTGIDAEEALQEATSKFMRRFKEIEKHASRKGVKIKKLGMSEMDRIGRM